MIATRHIEKPTDIHDLNRILAWHLPKRQHLNYWLYTKGSNEIFFNYLVKADQFALYEFCHLNRLTIYRELMEDCFGCKVMKSPEDYNHLLGANK